MTNDLPGQGHMTPPVSELEDRLLRAAEPAAFSDAELEGLPEPVRRHLTLAISPKTPLAAVPGPPGPRPPPRVGLGGPGRRRHRRLRPVRRAMDDDGRRTAGPPEAASAIASAGQPICG
jgi:hypothetical protein